MNFLLGLLIGEIVGILSYSYAVRKKLKAGMKPYISTEDTIEWQDTKGE